MIKFSFCSLLAFAAAYHSLPVNAADMPELNGGIYDDMELHRTPHTAGYVQGSYAGIVDAPYDATGDAWTLKGSINFNPERRVNIQADIGNSWENVSGFSARTLSWALHGYYRDSDYALGAFFQDAQFHSGVLGYLGSNDIRNYLAGLEGAYFIPTDTFYGRIGFGQVEWLGYNADHVMSALSVRHYFTDNVRFDVEGDYSHLTYGPASIDFWGVSITGNYRPFSKPITFFAGYHFTEADGSISDVSLGSADLGTVFGGVRLSFGSNSLKDEERSGPMWTSDPVIP